MRSGFAALTSATAFSVFLAIGSASATELMPNFATVPTGWVTDRYEPASFSNIGTYAGRSDVLGIGIDTTTDAANRTGCCQSGFYNTQGRKYSVSGGDGDTLTADLYIDSAWLNPANGAVRTDMWGTLTDSSSAISAYPIIGFTNEGVGGYVGLRVYNVTTDDWINLNTSGNTDAWNTLTITLDGTDVVYSVNGSVVNTQDNVNSTGFKEVIMQAYNFADPTTFSGISTTPYVAHWSNAQATAAPEPATLALLGTGLAGMFVARRRRKA